MERDSKPKKKPKLKLKPSLKLKLKPKLDLDWTSVGMRCIVCLAPVHCAPISAFILALFRFYFIRRTSNGCQIVVWQSKKKLKQKASETNVAGETTRWKYPQKVHISYIFPLRSVLKMSL